MEGKDVDGNLKWSDGDTWYLLDETNLEIEDSTPAQLKCARQLELRIEDAVEEEREELLRQSNEARLAAEGVLQRRAARGGA